MILLNTCKSRLLIFFIFLTVVVLVLVLVSGLANKTIEKSRIDITKPMISVSDKLENSFLSKRPDNKFILDLEKDSKTKLTIKGFSSDVVAKMDNAYDPRVKSEVVAVEPIEFEEAEVTLPKYGNVDRILHCQNFNMVTFTCESWEETDISFTQDKYTITFKVYHFTAYAGGGGGDNASLMIWDDVDPEESQIRYINNSVNFFADYTNTTSDESINGTGINCEIKFNVTGSWTSPVNMTFDTSSGFYEYNRYFNQNGTFDWNVLCNGSLAGYEELSVTDNVTILVYTDPYPSVTEVVSSPLFIDLNQETEISARIEQANITVSLDSIKSEVNYPNGTIMNFTMALDSDFNSETGIGGEPYVAIAPSFEILIDCHDFNDSSECEVNASSISGACANVTFDDEFNAGDNDLDIGVLLCVDETAEDYNITFTKWGYEAGHEIMIKYCISSNYTTDECSDWVINTTDANYGKNHSKTILGGIYKKTLTDTSNEGRYNVTIYSENGLGNVNNSETAYFVVGGGPWWSDAVPNQTMGEDGYEEIDLSPYASDNDTASEDLLFYIASDNASEVNCWVDNGESQNLSMLPADDWNGVGSCSVIISNGFQNSTSSAVVYINVTSTNDVPEIDKIYTNPIYPIMNASFNCSANVIDIENDVSEVNFTIYYPNGTKAVDNVNGSMDGNVWTSSNVDPVSGAWNCSVVASDGTSAIDSTEIEIDLDNDGYTLPEDCNDDNSSISPGISEILDNYADDDCDGGYDEGGDYDNDTIINENDNCPYNYNLDQNDTNGDGIGDQCSVTNAIINSAELSTSQLTEKIENDSSLSDMYGYANELGYDKLLGSTEAEYGSGSNATVVFLLSEDNDAIIVINIHRDYFIQNGSFSYCSLQNGSVCNNTEITTKETLSKSVLVKVYPFNNTILFFDRNNWALFNLTDGSLINQSVTYGSCSLWGCTWDCMRDDTGNLILNDITGIICSEALFFFFVEPTKLVGGIAGIGCAARWIVPCISSCSGNLGPCSSGHNCTPGEVMGKVCDGDTAVEFKCNSNGNGWDNSSKVCAGECVGNGECTSVCSVGARCYDHDILGWQNADCSWEDAIYCEFGCDGGACVSQGDCPSYAPYSCNSDCYSCPTGSTLCCPSSGEPEMCCESGSYCKSDGTCSNTCEFGWKCKDSTNRAFQYSDCDWSSSEECSGGCVEDGDGIGRCQEEDCNSGWKCKDNTHKAYQDSDCDWSSETYCQHGCSNGECRDKIGQKSSCTFSLRYGAECGENNCDEWDFDRSDNGLVSGDQGDADWTLANFDLDNCYNGMRKDNILYARLDFWHLFDDEDISKTDLRIYKGCEDSDVGGSLSNDDEECLINIGSDIYEPNNYAHVVEGVSTGENPCGNEDLSCGITVTNPIYEHADWDDHDKIVFVWYPERGQDTWYLRHEPNEPKLYLEYPKICSSDGDCGTEVYVGSKYCFDSDVYWDYKYYECITQNCYSSTAPKKYTECGQNSTGAWGNDYCVGNDRTHNRTQYIKGCSSASCTSSSEFEVEVAETCLYGCSGGICLPKDSTAPLVNITSPLNTTYVNIPLEFNFSASDTYLDSCWYTNDSGVNNYTLANCANTTYTPAEGSTTLVVYANDSAGNVGSDSITFAVNTTPPNDPYKYYIKNSIGTAVAWFGTEGNIVLDGVCTVQTDCSSGANGFILKNSTRDVTIYVNFTGDMCVSNGDCSDESATCNPDSTTNSFIVRNGSSKLNMIYMSDNGDLCLTGGLYENANL